MFPRCQKLKQEIIERRANFFSNILFSLLFAPESEQPPDSVLLLLLLVVANKSEKESKKKRKIKGIKPNNKTESNHVARMWVVRERKTN